MNEPEPEPGRIIARWGYRIKLKNHEMKNKEWVIRRCVYMTYKGEGENQFLMDRNEYLLFCLHVLDASSRSYCVASRLIVIVAEVLPLGGAGVD